MMSYWGPSRQKKFPGLAKQQTRGAFGRQKTRMRRADAARLTRGA